jgi:hypothetical protein
MFEPILVDICLIAATTSDLLPYIKEKRFSGTGDKTTFLLLPFLSTVLLKRARKLAAQVISHQPPFFLYP